MMKKFTLSIALFAIVCAVAAAQKTSIRWSTSYEAALEKAKAEDKPILIAFNMDEEPANDEMAREHYRSKTIVELSKHFVCVIASKYWHTDETGVPCPRFPGITCRDHRRCEQTCRETYLESNDVNSPQHLFVKSDGTLHRTKVWLMSQKDMAALMKKVLVELYPKRHAALGKSPEAEKKKDGKTDGTGGKDEPKEEPPEDAGEPETPEEIVAAIHKTGNVYEVRDLARRLVRSEDAEQQKIVSDMIADEKLARKRWGLALAYGFKGNKSAVPILTPLLKDKDPALRNHVAVALEDIADKSALKAVKRQLKREKEEEVRKNLARALGACANGDGGSATTLIKLTRDKSDLVQRNAIVALGHFKKNAKAEKTLIAILSGGGGRGGGGRGGRGGGRGGFAGRRDKITLAAYSLSRMESKKAKKDVEKRLERERNERMADLIQMIADILADPSRLEDEDTKRRIARAARDKIQRDGGPEVSADDGGRGRDGDRGGRRGGRGGRGGDGGDGEGDGERRR